MDTKIYPEPLQSGIELAARTLVFVALTAEGTINPAPDVRVYINKSNRVVPTLIGALAKSIDIPADEIVNAVKQRSLELMTTRMTN